MNPKLPELPKEVGWTTLLKPWFYVGEEIMNEEYEEMVYTKDQMIAFALEAIKLNEP